MRFGIVILAVLLTGCDKRAQILEDEYNSAKKYGLVEDQCEIGTKIADLYLQKSDEENYRNWKLTSDTVCIEARVNRMIAH